MKMKVQFKRAAKGKKKLGPATEAKPTVRIPRIAKMMALAIHFDQLIREGKSRDQAEIAELGHVSRARLTQIMNMLQLAPDIQEQLLFLTEAEIGRASLTERHLRPIAAILNWDKQRASWRAAMWSPSRSEAGKGTGAVAQRACPTLATTAPVHD